MNEEVRIMVSRFRDALNSGKFVITSEVAPPKGTNIDKMLHHMELLKDKVDAISLTTRVRSCVSLPLAAASPLRSKVVSLSYR